MQTNPLTGHLFKRVMVIDRIDRIDRIARMGPAFTWQGLSSTQFER